jgi:tripartite ATP-independent transporter DctP family solute receptor
MTKVSVGVLENFAPKMRVFGIPYLFYDREHAFQVLDGSIGQELLDDGTQYWVKGLGYYDAGCRSFYTKDRPILTPDDLKGLKIRVMESPTAFEMIKSFGGSPTPISWGELYTSLQQGVVDGAENNPPSFYLSRHYEVCKYYSLDEHTLLPDVLIIGTSTWNRFTREEQAWIQQAVDYSVVHQRELWKISEQEALDAVKKAGVVVNYPDKKLFEAQVQSIYERQLQDTVMARLVHQIKNAKK